MKLKEFIEQLQQIVKDNPDNAELTVCLADWSESYQMPKESPVCVYVADGDYEGEKEILEGEFIQIGND